MASLRAQRNAPLSTTASLGSVARAHHVKQEVWTRVVPVLGELEDLVALSSHKLHAHPSVAHVCHRQASGGLGDHGLVVVG